MRSCTEPDLSIVIPAYNEHGRIGPTLDSVLDWVTGLDGSVEVLVVDDGSRDGTAEQVRAHQTSYAAHGTRLAVLGDGVNRGKGAAVRVGMLQARGLVLLFTDADLSAPITEAPALLAPIHRGDVAVAIGSRGVDRSLIGVHQSLLRETAGRTFNILMRLAVGLPFKDTQCGFKAFRRDAARDIFSRVKIDGFGFDVEALYLARKLGYKCAEVPVRWNHVEGTKVSMFGDSTRMFADLLRVRWNDVRGEYALAQAAMTAAGPQRS
jgi:glycosyltransferase involved in cell wall biosynthesis